MTEDWTTKERGPWVARAQHDGFVWIQSDDATHDASLRLTGDFDSQEHRLAYAHMLAGRLNNALALQDRITRAVAALDEAPDPPPKEASERQPTACSRANLIARTILVEGAEPP